MTSTPCPCPGLHAVADCLPYDDLGAGRRLAKLRHVCTSGRSWWTVEDRGPIDDDRLLVSLRERWPGSGRPRKAAPSGPARVDPAPPTRRSARIWTPEFSERFTRLYNGGVPVAVIAKEIQCRRRAVSAFAGMLAARGYPIQRRQHGGARRRAS